MRSWWDMLESDGPAYGYFVNSVKSWLVVKLEHLASARAIFSGTGVQISADGRLHLGAAVGSVTFVTEFVSRRVAEWVGKMTRLAEIARLEPHCAYAAFRHSLVGKWQYLSRTIAGIESLLQPLEDAIRQCFIPALTNRPAPGDLERELLALPTRLGGLGLVNPAAQSDDVCEALTDYGAVIHCCMDPIVGPNIELTKQSSVIMAGLVRVCSGETIVYVTLISRLLLLDRIIVKAKVLAYSILCSLCSTLTSPPHGWLTY